MSKIKILVVEDEFITAVGTRSCLEELGYNVSSIAATGKEALQQAEDNRPDIILMDIELKGGMDGVETGGMIRSQFDIPIIYITAYADKKVIERAKITEPFGYVIKPFEKRDLHSNIEIALYKHEVEKKLKKTNQELQNALIRVEAMSVTDGLTSLYNHRYFYNALESEISRANRYESNLSCIFIDIDDFKNINDTYGHKTGDEVLKKIGNLIKTVLRETDVAARYGGEEFAILLPQTEGKGAMEMATRLHADIRDYTFEKPIGRNVTVSLGVSTFLGGSNKSPDYLVQSADKAMYKAKSMGKDQIFQLD